MQSVLPLCFIWWVLLVYVGLTGVCRADSHSWTNAYSHIHDTQPARCEEQTFGGDDETDKKEKSYSGHQRSCFFFQSRKGSDTLVSHPLSWLQTSSTVIASALRALHSENQRGTFQHRNKANQKNAHRNATMKINIPGAKPAHAHSERVKWNRFLFSQLQIEEDRQNCEVSTGELLFNFCSHPSLYVPVTPVKTFAYWQIWQRFGDKSWAKALAPQLSWHDSKQWDFFCVCVHLCTCVLDSAAQSPIWLKPTQQKCKESYLAI